MKLKSNKVLITGAGGFVGSHLVERLIECGCYIRCLVRYNSRNDSGLLEEISAEKRSQIEIIFGDLRDSVTIHNAIKDINIVFHLASLVAIPYSYVHPQEVLETNIMGTLNVMLAVRDHGVDKIVHTSTSEVYGTAQYMPIDEKHPLQGQSPYSASKIGADKIVESFYASYDLPVTTIRPFNIYGPRQSDRAVIPTIITQALTQREVHLGSITPTRDFNYVSDTVDALIKIAEIDNVIGQTFNIGSGKEISIGELADRIAAILHKEIKVIKDERRLRPEKSEVQRLCADSSLAQKTFGWVPKVSLDEGLQRTINWISSNLDKYNIGKYVI